MTARLGQAETAAITAYIQVHRQSSIDQYQDIFEGNRHRIYSLAFWMTDHEPSAEAIMASVFARAFAQNPKPTAEQIDRVFVSEMCELMAIGNLTLTNSVVNQAGAVRQHAKRIHLERAVVALPATERLVFLMHDVEGYDHDRIARTLGINEVESREGLFQARLKIRELIAQQTAKV